MPIVPNSARPFTASGLQPVEGSFTGVGQSASFSPFAGRAFNVWVFGTFVGTVQLERSFDGNTWFPISAAGVPLYTYTAPAAEQCSDDEVSILYRLNCTAWTSGVIQYRMSQ